MAFDGYSAESSHKQAVNEVADVEGGIVGGSGVEEYRI